MSAGSLEGALLDDGEMVGMQDLEDWRVPCQSHIPGAPKKKKKRDLEGIERKPISYKKKQWRPPIEGIKRQYQYNY
jgi:hypothetical protein